MLDDGGGGSLVRLFPEPVFWVSFYDETYRLFFSRLECVMYLGKINYHPDDDVIIQPDNNIFVKRNVVIQPDDNISVKRNVVIQPDDNTFVKRNVVIQPDDNTFVKPNAAIQPDNNTCVKRNVIIKPDDSRYFYGTFGLGDLLAVCKENMYFYAR